MALSGGRILQGMAILVTLRNAELRLFARMFRQTERRMVIPLARAVSHSGDGYLHVLIPLLLWWLDPSGCAVLLPLLALALAVERALYWSVKNGLRRPRPEDAVPGFQSLIQASDKFSFPSGHSSGAFLLATSLFLVYGAVTLPLFAWAAMVALSRILLGVHFPGDTVAGALMGSGIAVATAAGLAV